MGNRASANRQRFNRNWLGGVCPAPAVSPAPINLSRLANPGQDSDVAGRMHLFRTCGTAAIEPTTGALIIPQHPERSGLHVRKPGTTPITPLRKISYVAGPSQSQSPVRDSLDFACATDMDAASSTSAPVLNPVYGCGPRSR